MSCRQNGPSSRLKKKTELVYSFAQGFSHLECFQVWRMVAIDWVLWNVGTRVNFDFCLKEAPQLRSLCKRAVANRKKRQMPPIFIPRRLSPFTSTGRTSSGRLSQRDKVCSATCRKFAEPKPKCTHSFVVVVGKGVSEYLDQSIHSDISCPSAPTRVDCTRMLSCKLW